MAKHNKPESLALAEAIATEFFAKITDKPRWQVQSWIRATWTSSSEDQPTRAVIYFWYMGDKEREYAVIVELTRHRTLSRKKQFYWEATSGGGDIMKNLPSKPQHCYQGFAVDEKGEIVLLGNASIRNPFAG